MYKISLISAMRMIEKTKKVTSTDLASSIKWPLKVKEASLLVQRLDAIFIESPSRKRKKKSGCPEQITQLPLS